MCFLGNQLQLHLALQSLINFFPSPFLYNLCYTFFYNSYITVILNSFTDLALNLLRGHEELLKRLCIKQ
ncbi:hypothetical protein P8452_52157 [Trifolium repens]|nr:hypothetical protein P8452_52157 [Trifolium repens]